MGIIIYKMNLSSYNYGLISGKICILLRRFYSDGTPDGKNSNILQGVL
jgi:hypothetical protein